MLRRTDYEASLSDENEIFGVDPPSDPCLPTISRFCALSKSGNVTFQKTIIMYYYSASPHLNDRPHHLHAVSRVKDMRSVQVKKVKRQQGLC